jgi:hypothetical protein
MKKFLYGCCFLLCAAGVLVIWLYFTNEGVATEFRQVRQPRTNIFFVGIDVSGSIFKEPATLKDFKDNLTARLKNFIGDEAVSYEIATFGNPGCESASVKKVVSMKSPKDESDFVYKVAKKIQDIAAYQQGADQLGYILKKILPERVGGRVIIFSDLLNDSGDCIPNAYKESLAKFGENKEGQIIFLYPTPLSPEIRLKDQEKVIKEIRGMVNEGKIRAFFYHLPDESEKRGAFIKSHLENAIPATTFEIVWERASRMVDSIVSAVRG